MFQLLYISRAVRPASTNDLKDILDTARTRNETAAITGLLLYGGEHFFQILEGLESDVRSLFDRIEIDPRHVAVTVIAEREVAGRNFPTWWMGFKLLDSEDFANEPVFHNIRSRGDLLAVPGAGDKYLGAEVAKS